MATASGHCEENDFFSLFCFQCKDESKKPKLLPCQHSFCTDCLVQHRDTLDEETPFCCPTCHRDFVLLDDAVDSLPDNYVYDIVKDVYVSFTSSEMKCMACKQIEKVTKATHKCLDCSDTLCQICHEWHCRTTLTKHHAVVPIEGLKSGEFQREFFARKITFCDRHSTHEHKTPCSSYCEDCECLVCPACTLSDHSKHDCKHLLEARKKREDSFNADLKKLQRSEKDQQKRIKNIEKCLANTKQVWQLQTTEVYDKANEIFTMVEKIKEEKLAELTSHYEKEVKRLSDLLEEEKCKQSSLQATLSFTQKFCEHSSDSDFLNRIKDVKNRIQLCDSYENNGYTKNELDIHKQEIETLLPVLENVFGRIVSTKKNIKHKCRVGEVKKLLYQKVDMKNILGIAYCAKSSEILLAGTGSHKSVLVLKDNGTFERYINFDRDGSCDIAVQGYKVFVTFFLPDSRQLLVTDLYGRAANTKCIQLPDDDLDSKHGLFVEADGDNAVYVSSFGKHRVYRMGQDENALTIFLSEANDARLTGPSYLCTTQSGEVVISNHGSSNIQAYSKGGEMVWQYDGKEGDDGSVLPNGICCDEDGYVYVADHKNCRIQVIYDNKLIGNIPIDEEAKDFKLVPLLLTPDGHLLYGYGPNLVKISCWE